MEEAGATHAVILAAGEGKRLGGVIGGAPKCLMTIGGRSLLHYHLEVLKSIGVDRVLVVAGCGIDEVRETLPSGVDVVDNERFAETNSLYSLWMARDWVQGELLLINADVLADPELYGRVAMAKGNVLSFDSSSSGHEEEMKVRFCEGRLAAMSKVMGRDEMHGENVGILKFDHGGARRLFEEAGRLIEDGGEQCWAPAAVDAMANEVKIKGLDMKHLPWTEIDFPEDFHRAGREVWPAIKARAQEGAMRKAGLNFSVSGLVPNRSK